MPQLSHKKTCKQCPFRRTSFPGYLGASNPEEFIASTLGEAHMPCHKTINYEEDDWETKQLPKAALCAGALIFLKNTCKLPRDGKLADARSQVESDHENVFSNSSQFLEHHKREW